MLSELGNTEDARERTSVSRGRNGGVCPVEIAEAESLLSLSSPKSNNTPLDRPSAATQILDNFWNSTSSHLPPSSTSPHLGRLPGPCSPAPDPKPPSQPTPSSPRLLRRATTSIPPDHTFLRPSSSSPRSVQAQLPNPRRPRASNLRMVAESDPEVDTAREAGEEVDEGGVSSDEVATQLLSPRKAGHRAEAVEIERLTVSSTSPPLGQSRPKFSIRSSR